MLLFYDVCLTFIIGVCISLKDGIWIQFEKKSGKRKIYIFCTHRFRSCRAAFIYNIIWRDIKQKDLNFAG